MSEPSRNGRIERSVPSDAQKQPEKGVMEPSIIVNDEISIPCSEVEKHVDECSRCQRIKKYYPNGRQLSAYASPSGMRIQELLRHSISEILGDNLPAFIRKWDGK
jgi:hypothetical protein